MPDAPSSELNILLAALQPGDRERLMAAGEDVTLKAGTVLNEPDHAAEFAYFPRSAVVSLMIGMRDGSTVETGMIGFEGAVGSESVFVADRPRTRAVVTVPGAAFKLPVAALRDAAAQSQQLRDLLSQYRDLLLVQAQQTAACGVLHKLEGRLCRWLLQTLDRITGTSIPLTQEHLAQRLGVHRATLNEASAYLRREGVIEEGRRGFIRIKDRGSLHNCACECYAQMKPVSVAAAR